MRKYPLAALVTALSLGGCANTPSASVQNSVAGAEQALTAAEKAALVYEQSPNANPAIVAQIKAADTQAYSAVKAAEANEGNVDAALTAIGALLALIPS